MPIKIVTSQNQTYEPIMEGVWEADITRMFEHKEFNRFDNKEKEGIKFEFTIAEGEQKGRRAYRFLTPYLTTQSILWSLWKAARGDEPSAEELASIEEISDLIECLGGKPVKILVKNRRSAKGNTYYTVADFVRSSRAKGEFPFVAGAPEGMPSVDLTGPAQEFKQESVAAEKPVDNIKNLALELEEEEKGTVTKASGKKVM